MTRSEVFALLVDGEPHDLPPGEADVLVAAGAAEFVEARTFEDGIANKMRGRKPIRITTTGRRRAEQLRRFA